MESMRRELGALFVAGLVTSELPASEAEAVAFARDAQRIFTSYCYRCHGQDGANEGGFNYVLDSRQLVSRRTIVPGNAAKSKLFRRLTDISLRKDLERIIKSV